MKTHSENGAFTIWLEGSINKDNASKTEDEIIRMLQNHMDEKWIINLSALDPVSCIGMRVLMNLKTMKNDLIVLSGVSVRQYEIFEQAGLTSVFDVQKIPRQISKEGLEEFDRGSSATIYTLNDEQILKLFETTHMEEEIYREYQLTKYAYLHDVPTMAAFEIVRCEEKLGIVFERLEGKSISQLISQAPDKLPALADDYAAFLKQMHNRPCPKGIIHDAKNYWKYTVTFLGSILTPHEQAEITALIDQVPDRNSFIHGDYNPSNLLVLDDGSLAVIDLGNSSIGHPIFDLQGVYIMTKTSPVLYGDATTAMANALWDACKLIYFSGCSREQIEEYEKEISVFADIRILLASLYVPKLQALTQTAKETIHSAIQSGMKITF